MHDVPARQLQFLNFIRSNRTSGNQSPIAISRNIRMSHAAQSTVNLLIDTPSELVDLQKVIEALPPAQQLSIQPAFQRVLESTNRRRKILQLVQDSIGQLRLDMKYLVFDLEATRRERDAYQRQIEQWMGDNGDSNDNQPEDN
jgi:hypothetical protein